MVCVCVGKACELEKWRDARLIRKDAVACSRMPHVVAMNLREVLWLVLGRSFRKKCDKGRTPVCVSNQGQ